jgi:AmmeMemoRadiSam system protein B
MGPRRPAVAGQFYADKKQACLDEIKNCVSARTLPRDLPSDLVAGIVPHAGWMFSGDVAAMVFNAVKKTSPKVDTFVIYGAVHWPYGKSAAVYNEGSWLTPLGEVAIDEETAEIIIEASGHAQANTEAHQFEHSIEVQVPFIQYLFPEAKIVPVMVPPAEFAVELGRDAAEAISAKAGGKRIVSIGSTDLTHYGPRYGFDPMGTGEKGIDWAKKVNDQKFIDLAVAMRAEQILHTTSENQNACGGGAAAATVAGAKQLGRSKGICLAHTHSNEMMQKNFGQTSEESVGYAGIIF